MEFQIDWLVKNKVVQFNIQGDVTVEDLSDVSDRIQGLINESDAPLVHVLHDEQGMGTMPISLQVLTDALGFLKNPRLGWFIIYGNDDRIKKFISAMVMSVAKVRHRNFKTREETLNFLVSMDTTLPKVEEMLE